MATFAAVELMLSLLFSFFLQWNTAWSQAVYWPNQPIYGAPANPPLTDYQKTFFPRVIMDAVSLARHAVLHWPCDPANDDLFKRYFDPTDAVFANNIFRAVANVPFDLDLNDNDVLAKLTSDPFSYNPRFKNLNIQFLEDNPRLKPENGGPGIPTENCQVLTAEGRTQIGYTRNIKDSDLALISICKEFFSYLPMLDDVINPPRWAIDPNKDQSDPKNPQYYDGYHCDNLGDTDSAWMRTTAWVMLHECLHAVGLFRDVPNYDATIPTGWEYNHFEGTLPHILTDFWPLEYGGITPKPPLNGYGGWNAMLINQLHPINADSIKFKAIYNVDNYVAYASSSYFSTKCNREFRAPSEEQDWGKSPRHLPQDPFSSQ
ncbi:hypothetical protein H2200_011450 [Cladophialophora chaetospira]|uniref:Uncharacterized protein n=1 Tax=Cladophialophora chaetospira TaxID=386627 RepID=A0AA38WZF4_9EURO|nr:hypothetical protein H2200_011450 [Cladophialophora chaetospira]